MARKVKLAKARKVIVRKVGIWESPTGMEFPLSLKRVDEKSKIVLRLQNKLNSCKEAKEAVLAKLLKYEWAQEMANERPDENPHNVVVKYYDKLEDEAMLAEYNLRVKALHSVVDIDFDYMITKKDLNEEKKELNKLEKTDEVKELIKQINTLIKFIGDRDGISLWDYFDCPKGDYLTMVDALFNAGHFYDFEDINNLALTIDAIKKEIDPDVYKTLMVTMGNKMQMARAFEDMTPEQRKMFKDTIEKMEA